MPNRYKLKQNGFSLVELLVVVGIIIILASIGLTIYKQADVQSRDNQRRADLKQVQAALEQYRNDLGYYPTSASINFDSGLQITGTVVNPATGVSSVNVYLNILPRDPLYSSLSGSYKDYLYIARPDNNKLNDGTTCDNSPNNKCSDYCLDAQMEQATSPDATCITVKTPVYNFSVRKGKN